MASAYHPALFFIFTLRKEAGKIISVSTFVLSDCSMSPLNSARPMLVSVTSSGGGGVGGVQEERRQVSGQGGLFEALGAAAVREGTRCTTGRRHPLAWPPLAARQCSRSAADINKFYLVSARGSVENLIDVLLTTRWLLETLLNSIE